MDVDFIRRLPSLVIVGPSRTKSRELEREVRDILGDRLPRLRVVVDCRQGACSASAIADAILRKLQKENPDLSDKRLFGTRVAVHHQGRLALHKIDDKRHPWVVVDTQEGHRVFFSDSKAKALAAMHKLGTQEHFRTDAEREEEAARKLRAAASHDAQKERGRQMAAGELVRGPLIAGVQLWVRKENPAKYKHATDIQTLLFDVSAFTPAQAKAWAKKHKKRYGHVDSKAHYHRLRQHDPSDYKPGTLRTITLTPGIKAIVGVPLRAAAAERPAGYDSKGPRQNPHGVLYAPGTRVRAPGKGEGLVVASHERYDVEWPRGIQYGASETALDPVGGIKVHARATHQGAIANPHGHRITWREGGAFRGVVATGDSPLGTYMIQMEPDGGYRLIYNPVQFYLGPKAAKPPVHHASVRAAKSAAETWLAAQPYGPVKNPLGRLSATLGASILGGGTAPLKRRKVERHPFGTLAGVQAAIKRIGGMKVKRVEGEYRVAFAGLAPSKEEAIAYYTMDGDDAVATAHAMAQRRRGA